MRSVLSISLSELEKKKISERAKKAGKTVSEYILYSTKLEESLIGEDELLKMAEAATRDFEKGKTKKLHSLSDLI